MFDFFLDLISGNCLDLSLLSNWDKSFLVGRMEDISNASNSILKYYAATPLSFATEYEILKQPRDS